MTTTTLMIGRLGTVSVAALLLAACCLMAMSCLANADDTNTPEIHVDDVAPASPAPASLPRIQLNPATRQFVNTEDGRSVIFHGLAQNNNGMMVQVSNDQMKLMADWGLNIVRLGFHWHLVETSPGTYNQTYLGLLKDTVERFGAHGIRVILDMHQDSWSPLFCGGHGIPEFYSQPYNTSEYHGNGSRAYPQPIAAPEYQPDGVHIKNCDRVDAAVFGWATSYITYSTGAAAQRMYDNDQGILDRFGEFWRMIATMFRDNPAVLGYELLNEPWLGDAPLALDELDPAKNEHWNLWFPKAADRSNMHTLYAHLAKYVRQVDNASIVFFEPATGGNYLDAFPIGLVEGPGGAEYNDRQALAYHVYCPVVQWNNASSFMQQLKSMLNLEVCDLFQSPLFDVRRKDAELLGLGAILTEFGAISNSPFGVDIIDFVADRMDEALHSWTFWYLTPEPDEEASGEVKAISRTYARAVAGTIMSMTFDHLDQGRGNFTLTYAPSSAPTTFRAPTEVYVSPFYYPGGYTWSTLPAGVLNATQSTLNPNLMLFTHTAAAHSADRITLHIIGKASE
eukprot:scpid64413/ scgid8242/ Endoglycoceramidase; Glycosphingolipid-specific enzyme